jgi:hypothetical protein
MRQGDRRQVCFVRAALGLEQGLATATQVHGLSRGVQVLALGKHGHGHGSVLCVDLKKPTEVPPGPEKDEASHARPTQSNTPAAWLAWRVMRKRV